MIDTPHITQVAAQRTAFIHLSIARDQIQDVMGPGISEVLATLATQGITPTGPWFTHHLRMDPHVFDFEICVPIGARVEPTGRVQAGELRAAKVARTVYHGGYEGLGNAWGEFMGWMASEGLSQADDLWECYVAGPESGTEPTQWRTELNRPLLA
jgi:effector-binding domain-containing protein